MNSKRGIAAFAAAVVLVLMSGAVNAQERKIGDLLTYDFESSGQGARMGAGKGTGMTLVLAVDRINPDGSAHANGSFQVAGMPKGMVPPIDTTISPSGAIVTKQIPNVHPHYGWSTQEQLAVASNQMVLGLQNQLAMVNFNAFADGCARRTLHIGDSWESPSERFAGMNLRYKVTGREQHLGHDAFAVSMQSADNSMTGQGYYDPAAHLVVAVHSEMTNAKEAAIFDVALHP